jgi:hypothetical protein
MYSRSYNKKVSERLNDLFMSYNELSKLCNALDNDINEVIKYISKIIKYAYVSEDFTYNYISLENIYVDLYDIDSKYQEYVSKNKYPSIRLGTRKTEYALDEDLRLCETKHIKLPKYNYIKEICLKNKEDLLVQEKEKKEKEDFYSKNRIFEECELKYDTYEKVPINSKFIYYNYSLVGNIYRDYNKLYTDDRYNNKEREDNPLNEDYQSNINKIIKSTDFQFFKKGNVYEIENGRHRILYLLMYGVETKINARVTKRLEDQEVNIILSKLKKEYMYKALKDNTTNDKCELILIKNNEVFKVNSKEELLDFYNRISNNKEIDTYYINEFKKVTCNNKEKEKLGMLYEKFILSKYNEYGSEIITCNFTDFCKTIGISINPILYQAFTLLQFDYMKANVVGYDFYDNERVFNDTYLNSLDASNEEINLEKYCK